MISRVFCGRAGASHAAAERIPDVTLGAGLGRARLLRVGRRIAHACKSLSHGPQIARPFCRNRPAGFQAAATGREGQAQAASALVYGRAQHGGAIKL